MGEGLVMGGEPMAAPARGAPGRETPVSGAAEASEVETPVRETQGRDAAQGQRQ